MHPHTSGDIGPRSAQAGRPHLRLGSDYFLGPKNQTLVEYARLYYKACGHGD